MFHSSKPAAAGLLLRARRAGDIDQLLLGAQQQRRTNAQEVPRFHRWSWTVLHQAALQKVAPTITVLQ